MCYGSEGCANCTPGCTGDKATCRKCAQRLAKVGEAQNSLLYAIHARGGLTDGEVSLFANYASQWRNAVERVE